MTFTFIGYAGIPVLTTEAQSSQSSENFFNQELFYSAPSAPPRCNFRALLQGKSEAARFLTSIESGSIEQEVHCKRRQDDLQS